MALTELQLPSKSDFYANIQSFFTNWNIIQRKAADLSEFLALLDTADLDAMGVAAGQVRTDLIDARTVLDETIAFFNGSAQTQTKIPADIVDKIRRMS